jgi:hypothetical protein
VKGKIKTPVAAIIYKRIKRFCRNRTEMIDSYKAEMGIHKDRYPQKN